VAVVAVDTETGKTVLRRVVTIDDAGTVINRPCCVNLDW
jgi:CO/xanthine dehydrogenase Mo-binding subunit